MGKNWRFIKKAGKILTLTLISGPRFLAIVFIAAILSLSSLVLTSSTDIPTSMLSSRWSGPMSDFSGDCALIAIFVGLVCSAARGLRLPAAAIRGLKLPAAATRGLVTREGLELPAPRGLNTRTTVPGLPRGLPGALIIATVAVPLGLPGGLTIAAAEPLPAPRGLAGALMIAMLLPPRGLRGEAIFKMAELPAPRGLVKTGLGLAGAALGLPGAGLGLPGATAAAMCVLITILLAGCGVDTFSTSALFETGKDVFETVKSEDPLRKFITPIDLELSGSAVDLELVVLPASWLLAWPIGIGLTAAAVTAAPVLAAATGRGVILVCPCRRMGVVTGSMMSSCLSTETSSGSS